MLCNDTAFFSYVTDSTSLEGDCINAKECEAQVKNSNNACILMYLCHRTERSLSFILNFNGNESIKSLKVFFKMLIKHELVFFVPFTHHEYLFPNVKAVLTPDDRIPPLVCCQEFFFPLSDSIFPFSSTTSGGVTVVNIIVGENDGGFNVGHAPFLAPSFSCIDSLFQFMSYMMWLSNDELEYIRTLPVCVCSSSYENLSILGSKGIKEEISVIYPALNIGDVVIGRRVLTSGIVECLQGIISQKYFSFGSLAYSISSDALNEHWEGLSCIHVRRL